MVIRLISTEIRQLAEQICKQYGYPIPTIIFNNKMKRKLGSCYYNKQLIELNANFCQIASKENMENLLKHEIAHLKYRSHGSDFHSACTDMGVTNGFENSSTKTEEGKQMRATAPYQYKCPSCGRQSGYFRKPKHDKMSCGNCSPRRFNPNFLLQRIK